MAARCMKGSNIICGVLAQPTIALYAVCRICLPCWHSPTSISMIFISLRVMIQRACFGYAGTITTAVMTRATFRQSNFLRRGGLDREQEPAPTRSEEHTSELQSLRHLV